MAVTRPVLTAVMTGRYDDVTAPHDGRYNGERGKQSKLI